SDYAAEAMVFEYDAANRPVSISDGTVGAWKYEYDGGHSTASRVTFPDGRVCAFTLDEKGLRTAADLAGRKFGFEYDANGNLTRVTGPDGGAWNYTYDDRGNVTKVLDPEGRQTTTEYNVMDLPVKTTSGAGKGVGFEYSPAKGDGAPDAQSPSAVISAITDGADNKTLFKYDGRDRLTGMTDPLGHVTSYEYDGEGRLLKRTLPNGQSATWKYDKSGLVTALNMGSGQDRAYAYGDSTGLLRSAVSPACTTTLDYDNGFRISELTREFADGLTVRLTYDYPSSISSEWITNLEAGEDSWYASVGYGDSMLLPDYYFGVGEAGVSMTYDDSGLTVGWQSWSGWVSAAFQRDAAGRLIAADYTDGWDAIALSLSFTYSEAGLLTGFSGAEGEHAFTYDQAGRLTSATHPGTDNPDESFTWDAAGNRRIAGNEAEYEYDAARRLLKDPDDDAGNRVLRESRTGGGDTSYQYDGANRLLKVTMPDGTEVEYRYDAFGQRVERLVDGASTTRYLWNVNDVIAEFDGAGKLVRGYIPALEPDRNMGVSILGGDGSLNEHYYAIDDLGTVYALFDGDGAIVESYRYTAFGRPVGLPAKPKNTRLFAGMDYDPVTGLYYARARWYDPEAGLFLQRDPIPMKSAMSPYDFADGRPGSTRDPYGMESGSEGKAARTLINNQVVQPTIGTVTTQAISKIPVVGGKAAGVYGVYLQTKDLVKILTSKDPLKAGRDWYKSQWWNPAGKYVDSFLSLGSGKNGGSDGKGGKQGVRPRCGRPGNLGAFLRR
ncbi:MAG: RHS repeat protein, partial [Deltaproteobacteria bacterium]|nr:RHS repeat protein [Deltaproteobacteria bacterium]